MIAAPGRWLLALIPPAITAAVASWFIAGAHWRIVGVWAEPARYSPNAGPEVTSYADLAYLTAIADCMANGTDITTCDPYGRPFQPYGVVPGSILRIAGLGLADTGALGIGLLVTWVFLIGVLAAVIAFNWQRKLSGLVGSLVFLTFIAISPASLLGIERGQFEILIISLVAIGLALITTPGQHVRGAIGAAGLFVSVVLKYLSIGAFAAYVAPRRWRWWALIALAASVLFLVLNLGDLELARSTARADQVSTSRVMFSSTTAFVTWLVEDPLAFAAPPDQVLDTGMLRIVGAALFLAITVVFWWIQRRSGIARDAVALKPLPWNFIIGGGFALIVPFFLGGSNDYRLMFLVLPITGYALWLGQIPTELGTTAPTDSTGSAQRNSVLFWNWLAMALLVIAVIPAASMIPSDSGFIMPKAALLIGDLALTIGLAYIAALWIHAWTSRLISRSHHQPR